MLSRVAHTLVQRGRAFPLLVALLAVTAVWALPAPVSARWLLPRGHPAVVAGTLGGGLAIHAQPGADEPIVAVVPEGAVLTVLGGPVWAGDGLYYPVRHPHGERGWAFDLYLAAGDQAVFSSGFSIYARLTGYSD